MGTAGITESEVRARVAWRVSGSGEGERGVKFIVDNGREGAVWQKARQLFGLLNETGMAQEELAETIVAINHMRRNRPQAPEEFISELADALVCNFQIIHNNGWWNELHEELKYSIGKLEKKIESANLNEGH